MSYPVAKLSNLHTQVCSFVQILRLLQTLCASVSSCQTVVIITFSFSSSVLFVVNATHYLRQSNNFCSGAFSRFCCCAVVSCLKHTIKVFFLRVFLLLQRQLLILHSLVKSPNEYLCLFVSLYSGIFLITVIQIYTHKCTYFSIYLGPTHMVTYFVLFSAFSHTNFCLIFRFLSFALLKFGAKILVFARRDVLNTSLYLFSCFWCS